MNLLFWGVPGTTHFQMRGVLGQIHIHLGVLGLKKFENYCSTNAHRKVSLMSGAPLPKVELFSAKTTMDAEGTGALLQ